MGNHLTFPLNSSVRTRYNNLENTNVAKEGLSKYLLRSYYSYMNLIDTSRNCRSDNHLGSKSMKT